MKKTKTKLALDRETLKTLQSDVLDGVAGGTLTVLTKLTRSCPGTFCDSVQRPCA